MTIANQDTLELPQLLPVGDTAWTVEFGREIDPAMHSRVLGLLDVVEQALLSGELSGVIDLVPTFRSLTVHYDPFVINGQQLGTKLLEQARGAGSVSRKGKHWRIPVCFDDDLAPDLVELAQTKGMAPQGVIDLICSTSFQVYMIGFMPGFPYMGGLPAALEMPRLASPRKAVPARSLAVAGSMCAVYPWESPGGWRLLGRTPIPLFNAQDTQSPALLSSGDCVTWQAICRADYEALQSAAEAGQISKETLLIGAAS